MKFFPGFEPQAPRSSISSAMDSKSQIEADSYKQEIFTAVNNLPSQERALLVDIMRQLPTLSEQYGERGAGPRKRLEQFINDPRRVQFLDNLMRRTLFTDVEIAQIGNAFFIPDMDEGTFRKRNFESE